LRHFHFLRHFKDWKLNILRLKSLYLSECLQSIFDFGVILYIIEVNAPLLVEKNICMIRNNPVLLMRLKLDDLMVVELVPASTILDQAGVMASVESASVQDNSE
jgi:hypothetical protein